MFLNISVACHASLCSLGEKISIAWALSTFLQISIRFSYPSRQIHRESRVNSYSKEVYAIMPIVSSLAVSHAPMVFDGGEGCTAAAAERIQSLPDTLKEDWQTLFRAVHEAAEMAKATNPEVIFLNTPHGLRLSDSFAVYLNSKAKGNAEWNGLWAEYDVNVPLDSDLARAFLEHLQGDNIPAIGVAPFDPCEAPLRWGEVVPLWFFRDLTNAGIKVVIFSSSISSETDQSPLSHVSKLGRSIARFLNGLEQRVLYIASGDLAHTHETDCTLPLYLPDPKWGIPTSKTALSFDLSIEHWVLCTPLAREGVAEPVKTTVKRSAKWDQTTYKDAEQWLAKATGMKMSAFSCGVYEFGVLHGILAAEVEGRATYDAHLLCRFAPTYFGLLVAAFIKGE